MATGNPNPDFTTNEWLQFYHHQSLAQQTSHPQHPAPPPAFHHVPAAADTMVITAASSASVPISVDNINLGSGGSNTGSPRLNVEGRVGKASRRRPRASKRVPTTLLNTDTTNFRAMVQQFTGIPNTPFSSGLVGGRPNVSFALGVHHRHPDPTAMMISVAQQQLQQQQFKEEQHMFSLRDNTDILFANPRPALQMSDDFLDSISSHVLSRPPTTDNYIL